MDILNSFVTIKEFRILTGYSSKYILKLAQLGMPIYDVEGNLKEERYTLNNCLINYYEAINWIFLSLHQI